MISRFSRARVIRSDNRRATDAATAIGYGHTQVGMRKFIVRDSRNVYVVSHILQMFIYIYACPHLYAWYTPDLIRLNINLARVSVPNKIIPYSFVHEKKKTLFHIPIAPNQ